MGSPTEKKGTLNAEFTLKLDEKSDSHGLTLMKVKLIMFLIDVWWILHVFVLFFSGFASDLD